MGEDIERTENVGREPNCRSKMTPITLCLIFLAFALCSVGSIIGYAIFSGGDTQNNLKEQIIPGHETGFYSTNTSGILDNGNIFI